MLKAYIIYNGFAKTEGELQDNTAQSAGLGT